VSGRGTVTMAGSSTRSLRSIVGMVEIREIGSGDSVEELTELLHAAYAHLGNMGLNYTAVDQPVSTTIERIGAGHCLVAVDGGRLVGTIVVEPTSADASECPYFARPGVASAHQMAVAPRYQGQGIGSRLLDAAEAWARSNGYLEMALDTAEPAKHLVEMYARRGYRHVGVTQGEGKHYRSVFMSKSLDHAA
jgi:GNAT superfamily N-acetyltransferase